MTSVSFAKDIVPIFAQFRGSMMWRLDLTRYEDVRGYAAQICNLLVTQQMPPAPYPPLTPEQLKLFKDWIAEDYPA